MKLIQHSYYFPNNAKTVFSIMRLFFPNSQISALRQPSVIAVLHFSSMYIVNSVRQCDYCFVNIWSFHLKMTWLARWKMASRFNLHSLGNIIEQLFIFLCEMPFMFFSIFLLGSLTLSQFVKILQMSKSNPFVTYIFKIFSLLCSFSFNFF